MKRPTAIATAAMILMLAVADSKILGCEWDSGYFYQVTNLKGKVVGSNFPVLHLFSWYRQYVVRAKAKLTLYEYCWPCDAFRRAPVKTVVTDSGGKFDFGLLKPGHYFLKIDDETGPLSGLFQIEVKHVGNQKEFEIVDISPVHPDCSGGHEFIVIVS